MAVKNIHLISAALLLAKCDNFQINKSQIAEYTRQNGVDTEAVRTDSQKYEKQKIYAVEIVKAHARGLPQARTAPLP